MSKSSYGSLSSGNLFIINIIMYICHLKKDLLALPCEFPMVMNFLGKYIYKKKTKKKKNRFSNQVKFITTLQTNKYT